MEREARKSNEAAGHLNNSVLRNKHTNTSGPYKIVVGMASAAEARPKLSQTTEMKKNKLCDRIKSNEIRKEVECEEN